MCRERFISLWNRCIPNAGTSSAQDVFSVLEGNYSRPERFYHTLGHIKACLKHLDAIRDQARDPDALEMAVWFHDAVYETGARDNELQSAKLFVELANKEAPARFVDKVRSLIMVTVHPSHPTDIDEKFMVDIDLSSFGLPWPQFLALGKLARKECAHMSDEEFDASELEFFEILASRPNFYYSEFFRTRYEAQARDNLARKIADLKRRT